MRNICLSIVLMMILSACGGRVDFMQRQVINTQVAAVDYKTPEDNNNDSAEITQSNKPDTPDEIETIDKDNDGNNDKEEEIINPPDSSDLGGSIIIPDKDNDKDSEDKPTTGGGSIIDNIIPGLPDENGGDNGDGSEGDSSGGGNSNGTDDLDSGDETDTEIETETGTDTDTDTDTDTNYRVPMVQRYDIQLKDGRNINVTLAETILDNDMLQIRQEGDLMFKGLKPKDTEMAQAGVLKDLSNNTIYPVVLMETGSIASSIPQGGTWGGGWEENFYGEFQGENHAYDVFGIAEAKVNLAEDRIEGAIDWLTYRPADTTLPVEFLDGKITFDGDIKQQEWVGSAQSHGLINPENGQAFSETTGFSEGVFASPTGDEATHAMGHVTLIDDNNQGLVGTFNMGHQP